jgi:hypothetical protein
MTTKFIILAVALIVTASGAASAAATSGGSSSNSSSPSNNSGGGGHSGGAGGGGSGHSGGGGHSGGALGGRGAAASAHGATLAGHGAQHVGGMHAETTHAGRATHLATDSPSKMPGMHHHHRDHRYEPRYGGDFTLPEFRNCYYRLDPQSLWSCGPGKTGAARGSNPRS